MRTCAFTLVFPAAAVTRCGDLAQRLLRVRLCVCVCVCVCLGVLCKCVGRESIALVLCANHYHPVYTRNSVCVCVCCAVAVVRLFDSLVAHCHISLLPLLLFPNIAMER